MPTTFVPTPRNYCDGDKAQAPKEWATLRSTPSPAPSQPRANRVLTSSTASSPVDHRWHHDSLGLHLRHAHQLLPQAHTRPLSCSHGLDAFARSSQCRQSVLCAVAQPVLLFSAATDDCSILADPASPIFRCLGLFLPNRVALRHRHRYTFLISYPTSKGRLEVLVENLWILITVRVRRQEGFCFGIFICLVRGLQAAGIVWGSH